MLDPARGIVVKTSDAARTTPTTLLELGPEAARQRFEQLWVWSQKLSKPSGRLVEYPIATFPGKHGRSLFLIDNTTRQHEQQFTRTLEFEERRIFGFHAVWHGKRFIFTNEVKEGQESFSLELAFGCPIQMIAARTTFKRVAGNFSGSSELRVDIEKEHLWKTALNWARLVYEGDPFSFADGFKIVETRSVDYVDGGPGQQFHDYRLRFDWAGLHLFKQSDATEQEVDPKKISGGIAIFSGGNALTSFDINSTRVASYRWHHKSGRVGEDFAHLISDRLYGLEEEEARLDRTPPSKDEALQIYGPVVRVFEGQSLAPAALELGMCLNSFDLTPGEKYQRRFERAWGLATSLFGDGEGTFLNVPLEVPREVGGRFFCISTFRRLRDYYGREIVGRELAGHERKGLGGESVAYGKRVALRQFVLRREGEFLEIERGFDKDGEEVQVIDRIRLQEGTASTTYRIVLRKKESLAALLGLQTEELAENLSLQGKGLNSVLKLAVALLGDKLRGRFGLFEPGQFPTFRLEIEEGTNVGVYGVMLGKGGNLQFEDETGLVPTLPSEGRFLSLTSTTQDRQPTTGTGSVDFQKEPRHRILWEENYFEISTTQWDDESLPYVLSAAYFASTVYEMEAFDHMSPLRQEEWLLRNGYSSTVPLS